MISTNTDETIDQYVKAIHSLANEATENDADLKAIGTSLVNIFNRYHFNGGGDIENIRVEDLKKHFRKEELYHYKQMTDAEIFFDFSELHKMDPETFEFAISILKDLKVCNEMKIENAQDLAIEALQKNQKKKNEIKTIQYYLECSDFINKTIDNESDIYFKNLHGHIDDEGRIYEPQPEEESVFYFNRIYGIALNIYNNIEKTKAMNKADDDLPF